MSKNLLHCTPIDSKGILALAIQFGVIDAGLTMQQFISRWKAHKVYDVRGPWDKILRFYVSEPTNGVGPIFLMDRVIFSKFLVLAEGGEGLHCKGCADIIIQWFFEQQPIWAEKYHVEWWASNSENDNTKPQRLH